MLNRRTYPPPECIGCYSPNPQKGEYHIFKKGALCLTCAIEIKTDAHKNFAGVHGANNFENR
jgi:hypothetical protein